MLIQILFSLGVEQRSREIGLLESAGFSKKRIRQILMTEGALIALGGALVGTILALAYAWGLVKGLNTIWLGAIGSPFVKLSASPMTLAMGASIGWFVAMLSIFLCLRRLRKLSARALLSGRTEIPANRAWQAKRLSDRGNRLGDTHGNHAGSHANHFRRARNRACFSHPARCF